MAYLVPADIQTWIEQTKLTVSSVDLGLEAVARSKVFGRLADSYSTSSWLDATGTPVLVRQVMAMFIAAWLYRRQYSEDTDATPNYADWLEGLANQLLDGIDSGAIDLPEVEGIPTIGQPDFYPRDINYNEFGQEIDNPAFKMSMGF